MKWKLKKDTPMYPKGTIGEAAPRTYDEKTWIFKADNGEYYVLLPTAKKDEWLEEVDERWKPEPNETYYFMEAGGDVTETHNDGSRGDKNLISIGNYFRTRELAERAAEQIKALLKEFHKNNP